MGWMFWGWWWWDWGRQQEQRGCSFVFLTQPQPSIPTSLFFLCSCSVSHHSRTHFPFRQTDVPRTHTGIFLHRARVSLARTPCRPLLGALSLCPSVYTVPTSRGSTLAANPPSQYRSSTSAFQPPATTTTLRTAKRKQWKPVEVEEPISLETARQRTQRVVCFQPTSRHQCPHSQCDPPTPPPSYISVSNYQKSGTAFPRQQPTATLPP